MPTPLEIIIGGLMFGYALGLGIYIEMDDGKEKPEPIETDVEHGPDGKKLSKWNPLYWATILVEGLFSWPAALIRKALGKPQKF